MITNTINALKNELRMQDIKSDPWAIAMGAFFQVAAHTYELGDCPAEWGFKVGIAGNHIDPEDSMTDFLAPRDYDTLIEYGDYLHRLTRVLDKAGMSY